MLGVPARLKEIKKIANKYKIPIIEDTAWGCGGYYDEKPLGTYGEMGTFSFDFAKTMTTGEGGMITFHDSTLYEKAAAWHDHGHENNPSLPRWEDSRSSSGFNYRMNELQGAIGLAQLKKLDFVIDKQRDNYKKIWNAINDLPIVERSKPRESVSTCDALVFFVENKHIAIDCRKSLIDKGFGTKILPEAITWHFAGTWDHMDELVKNNQSPLIDAFPKSFDYLSKAVSLPISINIEDNVVEKIRQALKSVLQ
tara:strand:- start:319 stop:1077 length:759 start_codon:yes stop_codon:yes gene_type:complete